MKLLIPIHSFVDLITNSSSELFVCNTNKSIEAVKEILFELYHSASNDDNEFNRNIDRNELFTNVFNEPTLCRIDFDIKLYPDYKEYSKYFKNQSEYDTPFQKECESICQDFAALNTTDHDDKLYNEQMQILRNIYWDEQEKATDKLYNWCLEYNNINSTDIDYQAVQNLIRNAICHNYPLIKNSILIESASDNSVPYGVFESINKTLNAFRIHGG